MYSEDKVDRIKKGAHKLAKGGTLLQEPCPKCGGVQVKLGQETSCVDCGDESVPLQEEQNQEGDKTRVAAGDFTFLTKSASLIEEKLALIASDLRAEKDISIQVQRLELLEKYLGVLEKIKDLIKRPA